LFNHQRASSQSSVLHLDPATNEKLAVVHAALEKEERGNKHFDPEKQKDEDFDRPFLLTHAIMVGLAMVLVVVVEMACVAKLLTEVRLDGQMMRLALVSVFHTWEKGLILTSHSSLGRDNTFVRHIQSILHDRDHRITFSAVWSNA
jgi:hypothetical protein